jgi:hemoglobin
MRDIRRPSPTRDLDDPEQIAEMVRRFYADVAQDGLLGPMFHDVAHVDWSEHLPKLAAFWCRALLGLDGYTGNPFRAHALIHAQRSFTAAHFARWLSLFHDTVELGWTGPRADRALALAEEVARVHRRRLFGTPDELSLWSLTDLPSGA